MEAEINMVLDIGYAVECILLLTSHKWYVDIRHLAYVLKMSCEELQEVLVALKTVGEGVERVDQVDRSCQIRSRTITRYPSASPWTMF